MTDHEAACIDQGVLQERRRIFDIIARLPIAECKCERWLTEMHTHAPDCEWNNELTYRSRLLIAITTPEAGLDGAESRARSGNDSSSASAAAAALNRLPSEASTG